MSFCRRLYWAFILLLRSRTGFERILYVSLISTLIAAEIVLYAVYAGEEMYLDVGARAFALAGLYGCASFFPFICAEGEFMKVIGEILMGAGLFIMLCGIAGLLKNPGFYRRLLLSSLIDTVGLLVLLAGVAVRQGLGSFSFKVILLMGIVILTAPLSAHKLGRAAYLSGHREGRYGA